MHHLRTIRESITPRVVIQVFFFIVVIPFIPLLITRDWDWREAWFYAAIYILGFFISRVLAARRHPDLIAERAKFLRQADAKGWDKLLSPLLGLGGILVLVVIGLDALLDWSPSYSLELKIFALVIIAAGYILGSYALIENRYFSGMVRIQFERGHHVITGGPYRWMRHPGYAAALLTYLGTPVFLDSGWAFLPVIFLFVILILRTSLEDKTLQDELEGYREYAGRVRYRLLPGVW